MMKLDSVGWEWSLTFAVPILLSLILLPCFYALVGPSKDIFLVIFSQVSRFIFSSPFRSISALCIFLLKLFSVLELQLKACCILLQVVKLLSQFNFIVFGFIVEPTSFVITSRPKFDVRFVSFIVSILFAFM